MEQSVAMPENKPDERQQRRSELARMDSAQLINLDHQLHQKFMDLQNELRTAGPERRPEIIKEQSRVAGEDFMVQEAYLSRNGRSRNLEPELAVSR